MYEPRRHFGKEFFIGCVSTDIAMCFILKDLGTNIAKENGDRPYFRSSNENFWLAEAKEDLRKARNTDWSEGEFQISISKTVNSTLVEVSQALKWASRDGLIKREKWGKVLKEYFALVKEMQDRLKKVEEK